MLLSHIKHFLKIKRSLELISLPHFLHNFWRKIFILLYSINWPRFIAWLLLLCEILGNMCIAIIFKPGCDVMNFEINLIFPIKPFFSTLPKIHHKNLKSDSHFPKKIVLFASWKPFKIDEKCFLFHLRSSFRSQDI